MFVDRNDAGKQLARALQKNAGVDPLVLAIPRGGVAIGYEVATALGAELDLLITRKLPLPYQPEAGFGAIAEDGSRVVIDRVARRLAPETVETVIEKQQREIQRRIETLRDHRPLTSPTGRTVILVDDGIAMGSTMKASTLLCKRAGSRRIIVAVPVAGKNVAQRFAALVDDIVVLDSPRMFRAVAQVYENWYDVPDEEVREIMERYHREMGTEA